MRVCMRVCMLVCMRACVRGHVGSGCNVPHPARDEARGERAAVEESRQRLVAHGRAASFGKHRGGSVVVEKLADAHEDAATLAAD